MTKNYKILLWIAVFCFLTVTGWAREQIADFHSSIEVHYDSTMTVTETITVRAEGQKIRRGIYRDFPTKYKDRLGNQVVVGFEVKSVLRDGLSESYHIKAMSNGQRVYIGKENYFLPRGEYTYTLTYTTNRQLGFFEDHDELYWNVTGNDWDFPIKQASAVVSLPSDAAEKIIGVDAFTGRYSSVGKDFVFRRDVFGNPAFVTTRTLSSGEGLTIAISWPKGYVEEPKVWDKVGYFVRDNKPVVVTLGGLMLLLLYYLNIWNLIGRDPEKGTIIPLYDAPKGFSPASSRYIMKM
ncbi:MAG: DUF2207 domain-containing protein, partial [Candidatus Omnitrophica bacterium]|nr:DUF2207 domain-containing protein [Candidatus Omnitrophota bacterium]